uniref:Uncharacterized protein n=1 Tax=viral metagenome TaxID=1070528 RepID=A0A6M3ITC3_9ZZZZ
MAKRTKLFNKIFGEPLRVKAPKPWRITTRLIIHKSKKAYTRKPKHRKDWGE